MRISNFTKGFVNGLWRDYEQKKHLIGQDEILVLPS